MEPPKMRSKDAIELPGQRSRSQGGMARPA
jgi:hypothetical protein